MHVKEAVEEYAFSILGLSEQTQNHYLPKLMRFAAWCESEALALEDIGPKQVARYIDYRRKQGRLDNKTSKPTGKPHSSLTLAGEARVIKVFLHWCARDTDLEKIVKLQTVDRVSIPKSQQKLIEIFTVAQIQALLKACDEEENKAFGERDRTILMLLLDTGIRAAELCGLTVDGVFMKNPHDVYIRVLGKGDKWREVGVGEEATKMLRRYLAHQRKGVEQGYVFINRFGKELTVNCLEQIVRRLGERAQIEGVRCSPHTFRHTFAVRYLEAGGDVYKLSRLMGHTELRMTENYLKAAKQREARLAGISVMDRVAREKPARKGAPALKVVSRAKPLDRFSVMDGI